MTKTYRLSRAATEQDTNRILVRSLSFTILVMLIPLFVMLFTGQLSDPRALITVLCGFGLLLAFVVYRIIRRVRKMMTNAIETYELTIDDLQITRTQRECPTMVIPRFEVKRLSERAGQGFKIETANFRQCIWVPAELEGYEEVKALLLSTTAAETRTVRHPLVVAYAAQVLMVVGFFIVMLSERRVLVTAVGAAILCFYIYYVFQLVRTWPNASRATRRALWITPLPALALVARVAGMWR